MVDLRSGQTGELKVCLKVMGPKGPTYPVGWDADRFLERLKQRLRWRYFKGELVRRPKRLREFSLYLGMALDDVMEEYAKEAEETDEI